MSAAGKNHFILAGIFLLLIAVIFAGIVLTMLKMFLGDNENRDITSGEVNIPGTAVILVLLIIVFTTGVFLPQPVKNLLDSAVSIIKGGN